MTTPVQQDTDSRPELTALIIAMTAELARRWQRLSTAQDNLLRTLERLRPGLGATTRIRGIIASFNQEVGEFDRLARALAERWAAQDLPVAYRDGALRALRQAGADITLFRWTTDHQAAITALSGTFYVDLVQRIQEAVRRAQAFARAAQDATRQVTLGRNHVGINSARLTADHPLSTIVYRDNSRHQVKDWAYTALSYQAVVTANHAAINTGRLDLEARWFQCVDGPECGFVNHPDTDHADGTIRSADDAAAYPIAHFGCVAEGTEVYALGALESAYRLPASGRMLHIRTATGRRLTITPNHPILTGRGWISAGEVNEADQVVIRSGESASVPTASDLDQVPAPVEDVFAALWKALPGRSVVPTPEDFHGDASMADGEVQVVGTQGQLWRVADSSGVQDGSELAFQVRDSGATFLPGEGHALTLGSGVAAPSSSSVCGFHVRRVTPSGTDADACFLETTSEGGIREPEFIRQAESRFAVQVSLDDVVEVGYVHARGHVYDLSTTGHSYFANGILVHNCIREWIPRPDLNSRNGLVSGDPV